MFCPEIDTPGQAAYFGPGRKHEPNAIQIAAQRLAQAGKVAVLTGAGISAESGVPTFRGPDGLWEKYRPEDLATPQAFARDPELVWRWYHWRRGLIAQCAPQPGPPRPGRSGKARMDHFTLITQNVDGLHRLAGSRNILEVHGNLWMVRCTSCGALYEERELDMPPLPLPAAIAAACSAPRGVVRRVPGQRGILDAAWRAAANAR